MNVLRQYDRKAPAVIEKALRKFGVNPYGQNVYRVVWSESRLELVGGRWQERLRDDEASHLERRGNMVVDSNPVLATKDEYRVRPTYTFEPCWVIEKWLPCSYSREEWYDDSRLVDKASGLHLCGPYPVHGDWHFSYKLQQKGKFIPVTVGVVEYYGRLCEASKEYTEIQRKEAIEERVRRERRDWENRFDAIFDDAQLAGGTQNLFVPVSGPKSKARVKPEDVNFGDVKDIPLNLPTKAGFSQI